MNTNTNTTETRAAALEARMAIRIAASRRPGRDRVSLNRQCREARSLKTDWTKLAR